MYEYLNDLEFLMKLDKAHLRTQYARITLLDFATEIPVDEIQGNISSGSLSVNGSSAVRRTINLSMVSRDVPSLDFAIDKKVKVEVGYKNPFRDIYQDEIIWFPCGLFIVSSFGVSVGTAGTTISMTGKDKMALLDGTAGGVLPASTTFHERFIYEDNGDITIEQSTIFQIIYEAVNHWGGEQPHRIIITDIEDTCKLLVKWIGDEPVYFNSEYTGMSWEPNEDFPIMREYGEDAGYKETPFTYPGELILKAGDTVVTLLDKIVDVLGNYEYFYDLNGNFIFQEIKNYLNTASPLDELDVNDYVRSYDNAKFLYSLTDLDTTTSITINPRYDNLKNDFYVWGKRQTNYGTEVDIRYHLAIDSKPLIDLAGMYMWEVKDQETGLIVRYEFTQTNEAPAAASYVVTLISIPCDEWREELYRRALVAQVTNSVSSEYYDSELLAEWRALYDPNKGGWCYGDIKNLNFWLDFIDTGSSIGKYSINKIGRRTKVVNNDKITSIYNMEVPDVVFLERFDENLIAQYRGIGQKIFVLTDNNYDLFATSSTGVSCFDQIREMLYQNLNYNTTIQITCLPKYYMEPNNIIRIEDGRTGIYGNYQITQFTLPLAYNGTMSITASEVLTRV